MMPLGRSVRIDFRRYGGVVLDQAFGPKIRPERTRNVRLERRVVGEHLLQIGTSDDECDRDVRSNRKLQCGRSQVYAVPISNRTHTSALLDGLRRNLIVCLAVVEARAAADEAGVQRRTDDKAHLAFASLGKNPV